MAFITRFDLLLRVWLRAELPSIFVIGLFNAALAGIASLISGKSGVAGGIVLLIVAIALPTLLVWWFGIVLKGAPPVSAGRHIVHLSTTGSAWSLGWSYFWRKIILCAPLIVFIFLVGRSFADAGAEQPMLIAWNVGVGLSSVAVVSYVVLGWLLSARTQIQSNKNKLSTATPESARSKPNVVSQNFDSNKPSSDAEQLWADALAELEGPRRRAGLWASAFTHSDGDELKAKAMYLRWRVKELENMQE